MSESEPTVVTTSAPGLQTSAPSLQLMSEGDLVRSVLSVDYEILEELGRGGMAVVYRAREKALDREVAIKVLPSRLAIDGGFVERFEHEARTAAKLEHPNIVPIYRVGRAGPNGEVTYFVMKLLRGQSLSAVLSERGKLDPADVRRILMETASALGYAAKRGVVHRDIKPDNIMLDSEGRCVVTDFGIAKAPGGQQTTAGTSLGTPRYMSPEHAIGSALDGRSDMYSLGIVAYQCLTGSPPFSADEPFAVLYKHIHDPLPQPTFSTDAERELFPIVAKMLAKNPDDRFQSGNELIAALGGQVSDPSLVSAKMMNPGLMAPTERMPTPKPWTVQRWRHFTRMEKRLSVLLVASVAVGVINFMVNRQSAEPDSSAPTGGTTKAPALATGAAQSAASRAGDSTTPTAPAGPSERAQAIIAYNKLSSACPTRDTLVSSKPIPYSVILDPQPDRKRGPSMTVDYDVCGLASGTALTAKFTLTKLYQRGFRQQKPHEEIAAEKAGSPRSHERRKLNIQEMSAGSYRLDLVIKDEKDRQVSTFREFKITDK